MQARRRFCSGAAELPFQLQASVDGLRHVRETLPDWDPAQRFALEKAMQRG